jgi:hypothetical protein
VGDAASADGAEINRDEALTLTVVELRDSALLTLYLVLMSRATSLEAGVRIHR